MAVAQNVISTAFSLSGVVGIGQSISATDMANGLTLLNAMVYQWGNERAVTVTPGAFVLFPDLTTDVPSWSANTETLYYNLASRLRNYYQAPADPEIEAQAKRTLQVLQANNKQFQAPAAGTGTDQTALGIVLLGLRAAGRITDIQSVSPESQDVSDTFLLLQGMWAEWQQDRVITVTPGTFPAPASLTDAVAVGQGVQAATVWNLAVRLRSAFGLQPDPFQVDLAKKTLATVQANNRQAQVAQVSAGTDSTGYGMVLLALRAAGRVNDIQNVLLTGQDVTDGLLLVREMIDEWNLDRTITGTPVPIPQIEDPTTVYPATPGLMSAIVQNLALRLRVAFGQDAPEVMVAAAARTLAVVQANNKQVQAAANAGPVNTVQKLVYLAYRLASRITDAQGITAGSQDLADGLTQFQMLLAHWQRLRWLVPCLVEQTVVCDGSPSWGLGPAGTLGAVRVDTIDSAFVRLLTGAPGQQIDWPLDILSAQEDYNSIRLKGLHTIPSVCFYDKGFPLGRVFVYPVPPAGQYELHIWTKQALQQVEALTDVLVVPPEYLEALAYNLAVRLAGVTGTPLRPDVAAQARASLQVLRTANSQVPLLRMPRGVRGQGRAADYLFGGAGGLPTVPGGGASGPADFSPDDFAGADFQTGGV